jgi:glucose-1-phosphate thymidylyltransferase
VTVIVNSQAEIRAAVGDGKAFGLRVTYLQQEAPLGLAHAVKISRDFIAGDPFVMYLGDNLLEQDLGAFVDAFERERAGSKPPAAQILLKQVPDPHRFGVAELDRSGNVVHLVEKPVDPPSDLALVGVYLFDATIHKAVSAIRPSARGELEITDAIQWLIEHGHRVRHEVLLGWWIDTGKLTPILEANRLLLEKITTRLDGAVDESSQIEGRVIVEEGAEVKGSHIRGPVAIAAGTRIVNSFIGPFTSIDRFCEVVNSEIEHSVVLERSRIIDVPRIEDSLIGREVEVVRSQIRPRALRMMVGDHCRIDIE